MKEYSHQRHYNRSTLYMPATTYLHFLLLSLPLSILLKTGRREREEREEKRRERRERRERGEREREREHGDGMKTFTASKTSRCNEQRSTVPGNQSHQRQEIRSMCSSTTHLPTRTSIRLVTSAGASSARFRLRSASCITWHKQHKTVILDLCLWWMYDIS